MADLKLERIEPWAPHVSAAPLTERDGKTFAAAANGTRTCVGGWQAVFSGVEQGQTLRATWEVDYRALDHPRDTLRCKSYWGEMPPDDATVRTGDIKGWDYLLPEPARTPDDPVFQDIDRAGRRRPLDVCAARSGGQPPVIPGGVCPG